MKKFFKGFVCAFRGLIACAKEERNFRFHLAVAFHLFVYLPFFGLTRGEFCLIVVLCALVISLEAVNSAIERAVDCTGEISPRAGGAKDMAAGAVLVAAAAAAVCGVALLFRPEAFAGILRFFARFPAAALLQAIAAVWWFGFIFRGKGKEEKGDK